MQMWNLGPPIRPICSKFVWKLVMARGKTCMESTWQGWGQRRPVCWSAVAGGLVVMPSAWLWRQPPGWAGPWGPHWSSSALQVVALTQAAGFQSFISGPPLVTCKLSVLLKIKSFYCRNEQSGFLCSPEGQILYDQDWMPSNRHFFFFKAEKCNSLLWIISVCLASNLQNVFCCNYQQGNCCRWIICIIKGGFIIFIFSFSVHWRKCNSFSVYGSQFYIDRRTPLLDHC